MSLGRIVVVEDETPIRVGVCEALRNAGFEAIEAADGELGLAAARRPGVDLVLLDLMLPRMDGMSVLRELRKTHPVLPVIVVTARGTEDDRVDGLQEGADDYVVKPFSARELTARVGAVLRRSPERPGNVRSISLGAANVDFERREASSPGTPRLALSETECGILAHLASNAGRAISRDEILTRLWGITGGGVETRTIDMHVARLRSKLSGLAAGSADDWIVTVRGKGYMLGADIRVENAARSG